MASVEFKNITKIYPSGHLAVSDISLSIGDGEFFVIVGPSGCGKSTLLRMTAGLEDITRGEIAVGDAIINNFPPGKRNISMVFQNYALFPHMTVFDNMAFGLRIRHTAKTEMKRLVENAAEKLGLSEYLAKRPRELSGGQRQRVALGRALVRQPDVFLFDEPLSNLDAKLRSEMRTELLRLHSDVRTTSLYVTHDQVEAMTLGDRICVLNDGTIQQIDTAETIYNSPANLFVATFVGSPRMNTIEGTININAQNMIFVRENIEIPFDPDIVGLRESLISDGCSVTVGIRPESMSLSKSSPAHVPLEAAVSVVELIGGESLVHCTCDGTPLTAKIPSEERPARNEKVTLYVDTRKTRFFDKKGNAMQERTSN